MTGQGSAAQGRALAGKLIVVTGVSSGMGQAAARMAREQGARVIGVDINPAPDDWDAFHLADLSRADDIARLCRDLPDGIDGLCNIAGLAPTAPAEKVMAVNYFGLKALTLGLVGRLADGASIVNLASLAGSGWPRRLPLIAAAEACDLAGVAGFCREHGVTSYQGMSYFLSKEALTVWTMKMRWAWRDRGIRMNTVSPGPVETPILPDFLATLGDRPSARPGLMDRHGRVGDVAPVVCFLLSDAAAWIRGTNIPVDGGMYAHMTLAGHGI